MPLLVMVVLGSLWFTGPALAATITVGPAGCTPAAVGSAITSAANGDTVSLTCTGSITWSSTITIPNTKGITLQVSGGSYATPPGTFPLLITCATGADPCIQANIGNGNAVTRITGFHFTDTFAPISGIIFVSGHGVGPNGIGGFRIDNNFFESVQVGQVADLKGTVTVWTATSGSGILTGVIDTNHFLDTSYTDSYVIQVNDQSEFGGSGVPFHGGNAWNRALGWGTSDFIFIENNLIEQQTKYARHLIAAIQGAKYVSRYNTFISNIANAGNKAELNEGHGYCICSSIGHGTRGGEIYNNTYSGSQVGIHINLRGGSWTVHDNIFSSVPSTAYIILKEYRCFSSPDCTSTCASDPSWNPTVTTLADYPLREQIGWNFQKTSEPSYFWNNQGHNPTVDSSGITTSYIQLNREYFITPAPGYVTYTYPHPLTATTDTTPPAPPTGVFISSLPQEGS